jgi:hypothetical protein
VAKSGDESGEDADQRVEYVESLLRSDDMSEQTRGIELVENGEALPTDRLADLVPALAECAADQNPYVKQRASTVLEDLVSTHHELVAPAVVDVFDRLPFDDEAVAPVVGSLRDEVRNSPDVALRVGVDEATSLLSSDCPSAQKVGFTLLGSSTDPRAVDELAKWIDVGGSNVERAAREAIERLAERAIERLGTDGSGRAAESLCRTAKTDPTVLQPHLDRILSLFERRPHEAFEDLLFQLLVEETDVRPRLLDRLKEFVRPEDPTNQDAQTCAEVALDILVRFQYGDIPTDEMFGAYLEWSNADDAEVRRHVCGQLAILSDHSPENLRQYYSDLATLVASADGSVGKRAATLYTHAANSPQKFLALGVPILARETDRLAIDVLCDVLGVLSKRPEDGTAERLECTSAVRQTLDDLVSRFESGRNVPVVWPAYAPEVSVLLSLTLALEHVDEDFTLGLFSPGTQTQWGLKGDVRAEYDEYGLQLPGWGFVPVSNLVPRASVRDDEIVVDDPGENLDATFVVSKSPDELSLLAEQDCVVVQYCSRAKLDHREVSDELLGDASSCPIVTTYSLYTKHETNGYPRYGPPGGLEETESLPSTRALETAVEQSSLMTDGRSLSPFEGDVASLAEETEIEVREVRADDHEELLADLEAAYEASKELRNDRMPAPANKVFSLHLFFERLPLPSTVYDEGIRARHREGQPARYIPNTVDRRVRNLENYGGNVDEHGAVQRVFGAVDRLDRVADKLRDTNPIFNEIVKVVRDADRAGDRVAVYAPSKTIRSVLRRAIEDEVSRLSDQTLSVVTSDTVRPIDDHDRLVFAGPQRPQEAGFYIHPRVDDVVVLTFDVEWASMIREHAEEYVRRLNESVGEPGNTLFATPTVNRVAPTTEEETDESEDEEEAGVSFAGVRPGADMDGVPSDRREAPPSRRDSPRASDAAGLREAFEAAVTSEFSESGGNYDSTERVNYDVVTESEEVVHLSSEDRVFVKTESLDGSYRWESPQRLEAGDEIEVLDSSVEQELWATHLRQTYSDELDGVDALTTLELWDDTLDETVEDWADRMGRDPYDPGVLNAIADELRDAGCDRNPATIRGWFRSALDASSPAELARNPQLTIGPRDVDDVRLVGETFDRPELVENAHRIEAAMQAIRHVNRMEGRDFRSELLSRMNSDSPTEIREGTTRYVVANVARSSEREESADESADSPSDREGSDDEDETSGRVADLVEMQPTTNEELANEWGYESGSAVYGYLSQVLDNYYYRDSGGLIRASASAEDLVDDGE